MDVIRRGLKNDGRANDDEPASSSSSEVSSKSSGSSSDKSVSTDKEVDYPGVQGKSFVADERLTNVAEHLNNHQDEGLEMKKPTSESVDMEDPRFEMFHCLEYFRYAKARDEKKKKGGKQKMKETEEKEQDYEKRGAKEGENQK